MQVGPFWLITTGTLTGPWHVASHRNAWYIVNIIRNKDNSIECKQIGKVRFKGTNYCDRARDVARQRNELFFQTEKENLPLYLGICPDFDEAITNAFKEA